jgi:hypothetical protein
LHRSFGLVVTLTAVCVGGSLAAAQIQAAELAAGGFSFSDELGGFRLISASGAGTPGDPIVLIEEIEEAAPVTLVIRHGAGSGFSRPPLTRLTLVKIVVNRSRRVWGGFEVELQETLRQPSVYDDGLSFNQVGARPPDAGSDSFADNNRLFEPYDRIRFQNGHVDPEGRAEFRVTITDPTPIPEFYLVQDPQLLSAELPPRRTFAEADMLHQRAITPEAAGWRREARPW